MAPGSTKKNNNNNNNKKGVKGSPVDKITDDILAEIFSRVPYKSIFCCKCVSTRWRDLFSHPDHRKKLPQPLAGFFYKDYNSKRFPRTDRYFANVSGKGDPLVGPSLSFLPNYGSLDIVDCCNGLLLCRCWKPWKTLDYVVCNPATEKWVVVPGTEWSWSCFGTARIGFDPAFSSHFHVLEFVEEEAWGIPEDEQDGSYFRIAGLAIYSSKAGVWKHQNLDGFEFSLCDNSRSVFFNGILHIATSQGFILAIDLEGNDWGLVTIDMPPYNGTFVSSDIFLSQRQLCTAYSNQSQLSVWVLEVEDYKSENWTLKHNVSLLELFGVGYSAITFDYSVISFHPECNMIFIVYGDEKTLMSYDMDRRKVCSICQLGPDCPNKLSKNPYLPYVPLYLELEPSADGH